MKTNFIQIICLCSVVLLLTCNLSAQVVAPCHDIYVKGKCVNGVDTKKCMWLKNRHNTSAFLLNDSFTESSIPGFGSTAFWSYAHTVVDAGIMYKLDGGYYYVYGQKIDAGYPSTCIDVENGNVVIGYSSEYDPRALEDHNNPYMHTTWSDAQLYFNHPRISLNGKKQTLVAPNNDYTWDGTVWDVAIEKNTIYAIVTMRYKKYKYTNQSVEKISEDYLYAGGQYLTLSPGATYNAICSLGGAIYVCGTYKQGTFNKACYWRILKNSNGQYTCMRFELPNGMEATDILAIPCQP